MLYSMAKSSKKKEQKLSNPIAPAGMRADSKGAHGVPRPDDDSIWEEYKWRKTHAQ